MFQTEWQFSFFLISEGSFCSLAAQPKLQPPLCLFPLSHIACSVIADSQGPSCNLPTVWLCFSCDWHSLNSEVPNLSSQRSLFKFNSDPALCAKTLQRLVFFGAAVSATLAFWCCLDAGEHISGLSTYFSLLAWNTFPDNHISCCLTSFRSNDPLSLII